MNCYRELLQCLLSTSPFQIVQDVQNGIPKYWTIFVATTQEFQGIACGQATNKGIQHGVVAVSITRRVRFDISDAVHLTFNARVQPRRAQRGNRREAAATIPIW